MLAMLCNGKIGFFFTGPGRLVKEQADRTGVKGL
jgi:hypothetical protein